MKPNSISTGLVISEFLASNDSTSISENGKSYDWIKLKNQSDKPINLSEYYLSDSKKKPLKSQLTDHVLEPNAEITLYASGIDSLDFHLGFKLEKNSGKIILSSAQEQTVQLVEYDQQFKDISYLYTPEGWQYCTNPVDSGMTAEPILMSALSEELSIEISKEDSLFFAEITTDVSASIYYTLDGTSPFSDEAQRYKSKLTLEPGTFIRAALKGDDIFKHKEQLAACVPVYKHDLPVISLLTVPDNLYDEKLGLLAGTNYNNRSSAWVRPGQMVYYDLEGNEFDEEIDFKIFGNASRRKPKKSMTIRSTSKMKNYFFHTTEVEKIDGFIMRACHPGMVKYRNELVNEVNDYMDGKMLMQEYHPMVLYINGAYWGIYNNMERKNDKFVKNQTGEMPTDMANLTDSQTKLEKGSIQHYEDFVTQLNATSSNGDELYKLLEDHLNIPSIIDFWCHEIFTNRIDTYNNRTWKNANGDNTWNYISFDYDICMLRPDDSKVSDKYMMNTEVESVNILGNALRNERFREEFFFRLSEFMNFGYSKRYISGMLEEYEALTVDEFKLDKDRWQPETEQKKFRRSFTSFKNSMLKYVTIRRQFLVDSVFSDFGYHKFTTINPPKEEEGTLIINTYTTSDQTKFPSDYPLTLTIKPAEGVVFEGWTDGTNTVSLKPNQVFDKSVELTPVFSQK